MQEDVMVRTPGLKIPVAKEFDKDGKTVFEFKNPRTGKKETVDRQGIEKMFHLKK